jgi:hypothetical protein
MTYRLRISIALAMTLLFLVALSTAGVIAQRVTPQTATAAAPAPTSAAQTASHHGAVPRWSEEAQHD